MNRSKLEYCDYSLGIVTGCQKECKYCSRRAWANRFSGDVRRNRIVGGKCSCGDGKYELDEAFVNEAGKEMMFPFAFAPTLHRYKRDWLDKLKYGYNVLIGGMGDMFGDWVPEDWIKYTFDICLEHDRNNYMFMTQNPERYAELELPKSDNFIYGAMVTCREEMYRINVLPEDTKRMIWIDPIQGDLGLDDLEENPFKGLEWIILGAETVRKNSKVVPEVRWIENIVSAADAAGVPIFMRESMRKTVRKEDMRRDVPPYMMEHKKSDKVLKKMEGHCLNCHKKILKRDMMSITARRKNSGRDLLLGHLCKSCYMECCKELGVVQEVAENAYEDKKEEEKDGKKND